MATTFTDIITLAMASKVINDDRWEQDFSENPALFLRQKSQMMELAVTKFDRPPEMREYLTYSEPSFDSMEKVQENYTEENVMIASGRTGYELCSIGIIYKDRFGDTVYTPRTGSYDPTSGDVTVYASEDSPIRAEDIIELDFYTDAVFNKPLNGEIKEILCMCLGSLWETAFSGAWIDRTPKTYDKTFKPSSTEGAWTEAQERKRRQIQIELNDRLMKYEQNAHYRQVIIKHVRFSP